MSKNARKPLKPCPDFPLYSHRNGQWTKRIRGKTHFFGAWGDSEAALQEYLRIRADLQAERNPTPAAGVVSIADIVNAYVADADQRKEMGDLSPVSFADCHFTGEWIVCHFGRTVEPQQWRPIVFAGVNWFGTLYEFTTHQADCIRVLWQAWENRTPVVADR